MRDSKGRFKKGKPEEMSINFTFPALKKLAFYTKMIFVLLPWI